MNRRELLVLVAGAMTAATGTLRAQQKAMPVIGFLNVFSPPQRNRSRARSPGIGANRLRRRTKRV
jgi:hypothetical protein